MLTREARERLRRQVEQDIIRHDYRPTGVGVVFWNGKVLIAQSAVNGNRGFPQGGIYLGEDPEAGTRRELRQEIGLRRQQIQRVRGPFLVRRLATPHPKGYAKGKKYYCYLFECSEDPTITLDRKEITDYEWYTPETAWWFIWLLAQPMYKKLLLLDILRKVRQMTHQ